MILKTKGSINDVHGTSGLNAVMTGGVIGMQ